MPEKITSSPTDYIVPLNINKLEGRMMHVPENNGGGRNILLVYGHHAMLERWWGLVENLNDYGSVTMPDLPGFGGMDSFYKIRQKPTLDAYADYLAAFIKLRFKRKKITIVGVSYGFLIITRMLQRYPELSRKVDLLVSIVGFMHFDDFVFGQFERKFYIGATRFFATRGMAFFIRYIALNKFVIKFLSKRFPNSKRRMIEVSPQEFDETMDFEVKLWQANDVRTHWLTSSQFLKVDNCGSRIALPVYHVISKEDHYFNNDIVKEHMLIVFNKYRRFTANSRAHTPSILANKKAAGVLLPSRLRKALSEK